MKSFPRLRPLAALLLLAVLLEAAFLGLRRLLAPPPDVVGVIALGLAAGVVYLAAARLACRWPGPSRGALGVVLLGALVFRATLFPLVPTLSDDLTRYQWEGEIQLADRNPYLSTPGDPELAPLRPADIDRLPGRGVPAAYPPLTELLFRLAASADEQAGFKLLSVLFDLGTLLVIVGILRVRRQTPVRALLYAWCPLVVLEFAGSGHNDSLAVCGLLLANFLIIRQRPGVSILALAAATMSKWFAVVVAPVFFVRSRWWGVPLFAAAAGVLVLPYREAGWSIFSGSFTYAETWRNNESLYALLVAASNRESVASGVALGVVGGLALHLAARRADPLRACYLLIAAVLFLAPSVFPWYVIWLVPFLCFFPNPALLLFTSTVLLSYHVLIGYSATGEWRYTPWLVWLEYLPVYALLLCKGLGSATREADTR